MSDYVHLDHTRFRKAQRCIFFEKVTADCMSHRCRLVHGGDQLKLDACCQYGADVDLHERDRILERQGEIAALLGDEAARAPWFEGEAADPDFPSGGYVRTRVHGGGCIFLAHDRRGCAIHRAALAGGWHLHGVKPHVCRLYPLTYETDALVISDDYADYSCAYDTSAPTVYRAARAALADIFDHELVIALDRAEATVRRRRLSLASA